jgi:hypothetical protein
MDNNICKIFKTFFILGITLVLFFGCSTNQRTANKEVKKDYGIDEYGKSKKYRKNGVDIAYLTGILGTSIRLLVPLYQKRQLFRAGDFLTSHHGLTRCRLGYIHSKNFKM